MGFVGLVAPHMGRRLIGSDNRLLFPLAAVSGVVMLLAADLLGGAMGAVCMSMPLSRMLKLASVLKHAFFAKKTSPTEIIDKLVQFGEIARRDGILALEGVMEEVQDSFLIKGIQMAVDGSDPEMIQEAMTTELEYLQNRHADIKTVDGIPEILERSIDTTLLVEDGETIVLGGLKVEDSNSSEDGVPILKDIRLYFYFQNLLLPINNRFNHTSTCTTLNLFSSKLFLNFLHARLQFLNLFHQFIHIHHTIPLV